MKILVTGAAGFIGSNTVNRLVKQGHRVVAVDNLSLGNRKNIIYTSPNVDFYVSDSKDVRMLGFEKIDKIFHFGNPSSAPMFKDDLKSFKNTIHGFIEVAKLSKIHDAKLVFASTSSIYGPMTQYSSSRLAMENLAEAMDIDYVAMRYFSVYGPNEGHKDNYANCLTQFLWNLLDKEEIVVYGDGSQTRDFIHVSDVVDANIKAMNSEFRGHLDIGTGRETDFNRLIYMLANELNIEDPTIKYIKNPIKKYVQATKASVSNIAETIHMIGFKPTITLEEGIKRQIEAYR